MQIIDLLWHEDNVLHIAKHNVSPEEVEEVCFSRFPQIEIGRSGLYYLTGQTEGGRYLFIVIRYLGRGRAEVITARDMDYKEKTRYKRRQ